MIESDASGEGGRLEERRRVAMKGDAIIGGANVWVQV